MITRKKAETLVTEWFGKDITYPMLSILINRIEHMIVCKSEYSFDNEKLKLSDLLDLLEFLRKEKTTLDKFPTQKRIQKIMVDFFPTGTFFSDGTCPRLLKVVSKPMPVKVNQRGDTEYFFIVREDFDQDVSSYKGLSPVFSVWSWEKDKRPYKHHLDKIYSKQYVFSTFALAKDALKEIKEEYRYHKPRQGKIVTEYRGKHPKYMAVRLGKLGTGRRLRSFQIREYYPEELCRERLTNYARTNEIELN